MTNTNCLEGVRCPKCGHEDEFYIETLVSLHFMDSGPVGRDFSYDETDWICGNPCCRYQRPSYTFQIENQPAKGGEE
jgi:hypothetical protein